MMVVFMLKDLHKKQVVGIICSIDKIRDELTQTNVDKKLQIQGHEGENHARHL
jgi:hypothetical protein